MNINEKILLLRKKRIISRIFSRQIKYNKTNSI